MKNYRKPLAPDKFKELLAARQLHIEKVLKVKAVEYSRNNDALFNFNEGSKDLNQSRERYLLNLAWKQICSVKDLVNDLDNDKLACEAMVKEKFGDVINYMILMESMFLQRIKDAFFEDFDQELNAAENKVITLEDGKQVVLKPVGSMFTVAETSNRYEAVPIESLKDQPHIP